MAQEINENIHSWLLAQAEEDYRAFTMKLLPGTEHILGVRLPVLRKLAELGPRASLNEAVLKAVFGIAKDASSNYVIVSSRAESLDLEGLLYALLIVANRETPDPDGLNALRPETVEE